MKYEGVCRARQENISYLTGDILEPEIKELCGVSTTMPMSCEKYVDEKYSFVDVFVPQTRQFYSFQIEDFNKYFTMLTGWTPEK